MKQIPQLLNRGAYILFTLTVFAAVMIFLGRTIEGQSEKPKIVTYQVTPPRGGVFTIKSALRPGEEILLKDSISGTRWTLEVIEISK